jgi:hypothetical protein
LLASDGCPDGLEAEVLGASPALFTRRPVVTTGAREYCRLLDAIGHVDCAAHFLPRSRVVAEPPAADNPSPAAEIAERAQNGRAEISLP